MEKKTTTVLVLAMLALAATAVVAVGQVYAMGRPGTQNAVTHGPGTYRSGMGPSMMSDRGGYEGGMMGSWNGTYPCLGYTQGNVGNSMMGR